MPCSTKRRTCARPCGILCLATSSRKISSYASAHCRLDQFPQPVEGFDRLESGELFFHSLRRAKEETVIGLGQHCCVVEGIARCDDMIVKRLERGHRLLFLFRNAQAIIHNSILLDLEPMA